MPTTKRLRALLILMFGVIMTAMAFAGPATAAEGVYPPEVLGTSATSNTPASNVPTVAGVSESAGAGELAFTGANGLGVGAIGVLLLVGGAVLVFTSRHRKING
jgi:hypothetical protein